MFHIGNIDWLDDTLGGKNTLQLQMSFFQRKIHELLVPIKLSNKKEETELLKLKSNFFNVNILYQKPSKSQFQRAPCCEIFCQLLGICPSSLFDIWIAFGSFRRTVFENDTFLQSSPREYNMQSISIVFH